MERATGIELATFSLGSLIFDPLFSTLTNCLEKIYVQALHTVHALPDVRVAAGRLRDDVSLNFAMTLD
jgi:hypothetical protein